MLRIVVLCETLAFKTLANISKQKDFVTLFSVMNMSLSSLMKNVNKMMSWNFVLLGLLIKNLKKHARLKTAH